MVAKPPVGWIDDYEPITVEPHTSGPIQHPLSAKIAV